MRRGNSTPWNSSGTSLFSVSLLFFLGGWVSTHLARTSNQLEIAGTHSHHHSIAEVTCGIVCGCLPAIPAFLRHISGLKVKTMITSWRSTIRQPINDPERARGGSTVVPTTPTVASKSPAYNDVNFTSMATIGKTDRNGSGYHPWEELEELEYVAGDDKRQIDGA